MEGVALTLVYNWNCNIGLNAGGAAQLFDEMSQKDMGSLERNANAWVAYIQGRKAKGYV